MGEREKKKSLIFDLQLYIKHKLYIALCYFVPYKKDRGSIPSIKIETILPFKSLSCKYLTA